MADVFEIFAMCLPTQNTIDPLSTKWVYTWQTGQMDSDVCIHMAKTPRSAHLCVLALPRADHLGLCRVKAHGKDFVVREIGTQRSVGPIGLSQCLGCTLFCHVSV
jgi:hypothetical protein